MKKVYLIGHFDEECLIHHCLLGPAEFDMQAAEMEFQKAHDLYYPCWVPDASLSVAQFHGQWRRWREERESFHEERTHLWPAYAQLLAHWLEQKHGFESIPVEWVELPSYCW